MTVHQRNNPKERGSICIPSICLSSVCIVANNRIHSSKFTQKRDVIMKIGSS